MNEEFVKSVYETIVEDGKNIYKELYENTEVTERTVDYWKDALELYHSLNGHQKEIFINVVKQTMIDTVSSIFGVFDGSSTLSGDDKFEIDIKINGVNTENELQDNFLEYVEENVD